MGEGGTGTATEFASRLPISRQAISRHLKELEQAGLVVGTKQGREMRYGLDPRLLTQTAESLRLRADRWERSLHRLAEHLIEVTEAEGEETMADHELTKERTLDVAAEAAFAAFTEPEELTAWFTTEAQADLRPGGRYRNADGDQGEFLIVEPPERVRFTWDNPEHCPGTVVDVAFESRGPDKSVIRLVHHDLSTREHYDDMNSGWSWAMDSFKAYLETGHPISYQTWLADQDR